MKFFRNFIFSWLLSLNFISERIRCSKCIIHKYYIKFYFCFLSKFISCLAFLATRDLLYSSISCSIFSIVFTSNNSFSCSICSLCAFICIEIVFQLLIISIFLSSVIISKILMTSIASSCAILESFISLIISVLTIFE